MTDADGYLATSTPIHIVDAAFELLEPGNDRGPIHIGPSYHTQPAAAEAEGGAVRPGAPAPRGTIPPELCDDATYYKNARWHRWRWLRAAGWRRRPAANTRQPG